MAYSPEGESRERVYQFVRSRLLEGSPPSVREVQAAMGYAAVESARRQLNQLVEEGRLVKDDGRHRAYRLPEQRTRRGERPVQVAVVGEIRAGLLQEAVEDARGTVVVQSRVPPDQLFALSVRGDSMEGAGIFEGDLVVVRRQARAEPGSIVVAMVEGAATVKTMRLARGKVVLEAANDAYEPLVFEPDDVEILGVVVELRRSYPG